MSIRTRNTLRVGQSLTFLHHQVIVERNKVILGQNIKLRILRMTLVNIPLDCVLVNNLHNLEPVNIPLGLVSSGQPTNTN